MSIPITLTFASILTIFALVLSFRAGSFRGKSGISLLFGDPPNMQLVERVRAHQNFLEYVPMILIVMAGIEASGGSSRFLLIVGTLLVICRIAHVNGLKHDNMAHKGRLIGAGGTALLSLIAAAYGVGIGITVLMG